jgi:hypothetical protein
VNVGFNWVVLVPTLRRELVNRLSNLADLVDSVALISLDMVVLRRDMPKSGWGSWAVEYRTYGAPNHPPSISQPFRAGLTFGRRPSGPRRTIRSHMQFFRDTSAHVLAIDAAK